MLTAGLYNFTLESNSHFSEVLEIYDEDNNLVNLNGFDAKMQIRDFNNNVLVDLTTTPNANGDVLVLGGPAATVGILISNDTIKLLDFVEAKHDLVLIDSLRAPFRLLAGVVDFSRGVTA